MAYDPTIIAAIRQRAAQVEDPQKRGRYLRAALQTGIVESGLQNLNHGDADSLGWRQERSSLYKNPTNVSASVDRFFREAAQLDRGQPSWQLAADVQRPAAQYRGRYKDVAKQAAALLGGGGGASSPGPSSLASGPSSPAASAAGPPTVTGGQAGDFTSLLSSLLPQPAQAQQAAAPIAPPSFAAHPVLPQGFTPASSIAPPPQASEDRTGQALALVGGLGGEGASVSRPGIAEQVMNAPKGIADAVAQQRSGKATGVVPLGGSKNAGRGSFKIDGPNPDRLKPGLTSFADKVAAVYGGPLVGKDGSTHSKYTTSGNVSEHYTGNATDIFEIGGKPASGANLIKAGRAALIAAGMPRKQALKAPGGLYNVGRHQIIFGVDGPQYGGNHLDHLHISTHA